jgi:hypothetical protein
LSVSAKSQSSSMRAMWYRSVPIVLVRWSGSQSSASSRTPFSSRSVSRRESSIADSHRPTSGTSAIGSRLKISRGLWLRRGWPESPTPRHLSSVGWVQRLVAQASSHGRSQQVDRYRQEGQPDDGPNILLGSSGPVRYSTCDRPGNPSPPALEVRFAESSNSPVHGGLTTRLAGGPHTKCDQSREASRGRQDA